MQVLNACVQRKQWEGAFWVLQQLKQQGQQPSSTTYGLVMEVIATSCSCGPFFYYYINNLNSGMEFTSFVLIVALLFLN
jgi:hypothetical protein